LTSFLGGEIFLFFSPHLAYRRFFVFSSCPAVCPAYVFPAASFSALALRTLFYRCAFSPFFKPAPRSRAVFLRFLPSYVSLQTYPPSHERICLMSGFDDFFSFFLYLCHQVKTNLSPARQHTPVFFILSFHVVNEARTFTNFPQLFRRRILSASLPPSYAPLGRLGRCRIFLFPSSCLLSEFFKVALPFSSSFPPEDRRGRPPPSDNCFLVFDRLLPRPTAG